MKRTFLLFLVVFLTISTSFSAFAITDKNIVETALAADPEFTTLMQALQAADLADALQATGPFTVFAPTNAAFEVLPPQVLDKLLANPELLSKVLLYHVVSGSVDAATAIGLDGQEVETLQGQKIVIRVDGGNVFINDAQVTDPDIFSTNGVIHTIDKVLIPEWDIIETAVLDDDFNTLMTALEAANLVDTLKGAGPFTVFAPTDAAFANLPKGLLEDLLDDPDSLSKVLLYHVVEGKVMSESVVGLDGEEVDTFLGQKISITVDGYDLFVNDSQVTRVDNICTNGVIHVLNAVLIPDLDEVDDSDRPDTGLIVALIFAGVIVAGMGYTYSRKKR